MDFEIAIIGAGVVGLAIAARLSEQTSNLVVVEKHSKFGQETSSRNSEVVHSGIYYQPNSLKAKLCVKGQKMLYEFCEKNNIGHQKCGKYIVATNEKEALQLDKILANAKLNGLTHGKKISAEEINKKEPNVKAVSALHFPLSGIVDSYGLMKQLESDTLNNFANIAYNSEVININKIKNGYKITVSEPAGETEFTAKTVINSAGLYADKISEIAGIKNSEYQQNFLKGEYFAIANGKNKLVKSLIYPVPNANISLGIHATIDPNGGLKLGPSAFFINKKEKNYKVDANNAEEFYSSAERFLPFLKKEDLMPGQAGIRPQLVKQNGEFKDFIIKNEAENGFPNFINLIGIESPGLTSCLSIAEYVSYELGVIS